MGLKDLLKNIFTDKPSSNYSTQTTQTLPDSYTISQLKDKLNNELALINSKKELSKKEILIKITEFEKELEPKIKLVEAIDIDKRKDFEKLKTVVKENRSLYLTTLLRFISDLNKLTDTSAIDFHSQLIEKINNFQKNSQKPLEKATILIGKELSEINQSIQKLIREIDDNFKNHNFQNSSQIESTLSIYEELTSIDKHNSELKAEFKKFSSALSEHKKHKTSIEEELSSLKESKDYKDYISSKDKTNLELVALEEKIQKIKQKIDIKAVAKFHHFDLKKRELIANYSQNFKQTLLSDSELLIISLVKETLNIDVNELTKIVEEYRTLSVPTETEIDKRLKNIDDSLSKTNIHITISTQEISQIEDKQKKLLEKRSLTIAKISDNSKKIFPDIEITID